MTAKLVKQIVSDVEAEIIADYTGRMILLVLHSHPKWLETWKMNGIEPLEASKDGHVMFGIQLDVDSGVFKGVICIFYDESEHLFFLAKGRNPVTESVTVDELIANRKDAAIVTIQGLIPAIDELLFQK